MPEFSRSVALPVSADAAWQYHTRPGAFERLTPPWVSIRTLQPLGSLVDGAVARFRVKVAPGVWLDWEARHESVVPGVEFTDVQARGSFAEWRHRHRLSPHGDNHCVLHDEIRYQLPGALRPFDRQVRAQIDRLFAYRHEVTRQDLDRWQSQPTPLRVAVAGASGLVGRALVAYLRLRGHEVWPLTRRPATPAEIRWDAATTIEAERLQRVDAVINLAGENIFGRWSQDKRLRIRESRVRGTRLLAETMAALRPRPSVLVNASGINVYGSVARGATEDSSVGEGFLADVCREWEAATAPAASAGIRVVFARLATVLTPAGGALGLMRWPFMFGLGGPIGGRQHLSWVAMDDVVDVLTRAVEDVALVGPVNVVAPRAPTQAEFARTLAQVLRRPAILPVPAALPRVVLGDLAKETILADLDVRPARLHTVGHVFRYPRLEGALRHLLGREPG